jgi:hypothetical protein
MKLDMSLYRLLVMLLEAEELESRIVISICLSGKVIFRGFLHAKKYSAERMLV